MILNRSILTKNPCYKAGRKITVKGLMLHSIGCPQPSASVFVKNWNSASYNSACVHAFIDANNGEIYQTLPWDHRGWHAGDSANNTHIGVEMCEPDCIKYTGGSSFTCSNKEKAREMVKRTYNSAVELFANLCKIYGLDPMADGVIISHKEGYKRGIASNHGDPEHLWSQLDLPYTMETFRKAVKSTVKGVSVKDETTPAPAPRYAPTVKEWQKAAIADGFNQKNGYFKKYGADGVWGAECRAAAKAALIKKGCRYTNLNKLVQKTLYKLGYDMASSRKKDGTFDGVIGSGSDKAIRAFQKDVGFTGKDIDGKIGINTWREILNLNIDE